MLNHDNKIKQMEYEEELENERKKVYQSKVEARMNFIDSLHEELVEDEDLKKVKFVRGMEEEISKFQEKIKETVEALQKIIIQKNQTKKTNIEKFVQAVTAREKESEKEILKLLRDFDHEKKIAFREYNSQQSGWKQSLDNLKVRTNVVKDDLIYLEVLLMEDMENAIKEFDSKLSNIRKDMDEAIKPSFLKITDTIKDFSSRINDLTKTEFERFSQDVSITQ